MCSPLKILLVSESYCLTELGKHLYLHTTCVTLNSGNRHVKGQASRGRVQNVYISIYG